MVFGGGAGMHMVVRGHLCKASSLIHIYMDYRHQKHIAQGF